MKRFSQDPKDPQFFTNPYPLYAQMHAAGDLVWWDDYNMPCAVSHTALHMAFRDARFGRQIPAELAQPVPPHLEPFYRIDAHSMLELEPPHHTRLRGLVLRAFTSARIKALAPEITTLTHSLIDAFPSGRFDLLTRFCQQIPVIIIARLLGVPETAAPQLLRWSNDMVAMYQAGRTRAVEDAAARAATEFADFLRDYITARRDDPRNDLLTHLIAAQEDDGDRLSTDEMIATCVLLLNAGHEATVHTLGNAVRALLESGQTVLNTTAEPVVEEILRYDPPLHMFMRYAYEPFDFLGHRFQRGDQIALLIGASGRDPKQWDRPDSFDPGRARKAHHAFGGGRHFCVGAALARLEMTIALPVLFARCPNLTLAEPPETSDRYHFNGLRRLIVTQ